jgi:hypothetical protein
MITMHWTLKMFIFSVVGSLAGILWPILITYYRKHTTDTYKAVSGSGARIVKQTPGTKQGMVVSLSSSFVSFFVFLVLSIFIAAIASGVGFFAFLQNSDTRTSLQNIGNLGYFSAFSYGFSAASLIEEPLKK